MTFPSLLLLDLDDTVLATRPALIEARTATAVSLWPELVAAPATATHYVLEAWQRLTWYFASDDLFRVLPIIAAEARLPLPGVHAIERANASFLREQVDRAQMFQGCFETMSQWTAHGYELAILSNGDRGLQWSKMESSGVSRIIGPDRLYVALPGSLEAKPHPGLLQKILRELSVPADAAVTIGDRPTDVLAGKLAGTRTIHFLGRGPEAKLPPPQGMLEIEIPDRYATSWPSLDSVIDSLPHG